MRTFCRSSSWFTDPVTYANNRTHLLFRIAVYLTRSSEVRVSSPYGHPAGCRCGCRVVDDSVAQVFEIEAHDRFTEERCRVFIGRDAF
jgi:hypothetical protein